MLKIFSNIHTRLTQATLVVFLGIVIVACSRQSKELEQTTAGGPHRTHDYSSRGGIVPESVDTLTYGKQFGSTSDDPIVMNDGVIVLQTDSHILWMKRDSVYAAPRKADIDQMVLASLSFEGKKILLTDSSLVEEGAGELVRFAGPPNMLGTLAASEDLLLFTRSHFVFGATDSLYSYNYARRDLTSFPLANTRITCGPIIPAENIVVVGGLHETTVGREGVVTAVELPKTVVWERQLRFAPHYLSADNDNNIYVTGSRVMIDSLYVGISSFTAAGEHRWTRRIADATGVRSAAAVGKHFLYTVCQSGDGMFLLTLDRRDGSLSDRRKISDARERWSSPVLDPDGNILLASFTRQLLLRFTTSPLGRLFD